MTTQDLTTLIHRLNIKPNRRGILDAIHSLPRTVEREGSRAA